MRRISAIMIAAACLAALGGCTIGYNAMLFATKTNFGLDVDTQPPTVQLSIDRLEGVFAPTYEGGETPATLASFKYESDGWFSPYLGSAFATGDAAVVMSRLYDAGDGNIAADKVWNMTKKSWRTTEDGFDSRIELPRKPTYPWWVLPFKPTEVRPVLFGTDTMFGIKVAWSGLTGHLPDSFRIAYNRKELAIAPVTLRIGKDDKGNQKYFVKTPSLLATVVIGTELKLFLDSRIGYLQYFATGRAATDLAMRRAVREAMLRRLDPGATKGSFGPLVAGDELTIDAILVIMNVFEGLETLSHEGDTTATAFVEVMRRLGTLAPDEYTEYAGGVPNTPLTASPVLLAPADKQDPASSFVPYALSLNVSIRALSSALSRGTFQYESPTAAQPTDIDDAQRANLMAELEACKKRLSALQRAVLEDQGVVAAFRYFCDQLLD